MKKKKKSEFNMLDGSCEAWERERIVENIYVRMVSAPERRYVEYENVLADAEAAASCYLNWRRQQREKQEALSIADEAMDKYAVALKKLAE